MAPSIRAWLRPSWHLVLVLAVMGLASKALFFMAYAGSADPAAWAQAKIAHSFAISSPLTSIISVAASMIILRPIDRWWLSQDREPERVRQVAHLIDKMPNIVASISGVQWVAMVIVATRSVGDPVLSARVLCLMAASLLSVPLMMHLQTRTILNRVYARAARIAVNDGFSLNPPSRSLTHQLAFVAFAMCGAPTAYLAALALSLQSHPENLAHVGGLIVRFIIAVPAFWFISVSFLAKTVTLPVTRLWKAVHEIGEAGEANSVHLIPVLQKDELGKLTKAANRMVRRLVQAEQDRQKALDELNGMNATLENRVADEMKARAQAEMELRQAQKLESVGRLAAGIAHEINSPVQFVGDSVTFAGEAMRDFMDIIVKQDALLAAPANDPRRRALATELEEAKDSADLEYLVENAPKAITRASDGVARVAAIVRAMKDFAFPTQREMAYADLGRAIESTTIVAKNEYKYVADLETDLEPLPQVLCHIGELNQVVLNLIVNASHAIEDRVKGTQARGRIVVRARRDGDDVIVSVSDTGTGIPDSVRDSIFDPFFTTKGIGKGTGQGLAIARAVVVEKHGGQITFETKAGEGTTFFVRLPIDRAAKKAA